MVSAAAVGVGTRRRSGKLWASQSRRAGPAYESWPFLRQTPRDLPAPRGAHDLLSRLVAAFLFSYTHSMANNQWLFSEQAAELLNLPFGASTPALRIASDWHRATR